MKKSFLYFRLMLVLKLRLSKHILHALSTLPTAILGFKCPEKLDPHSVSAKFWPHPRFAIPGDCERLITCVNGYPRLITCGDGKVLDETTLTCEEPEDANSKWSVTNQYGFVPNWLIAGGQDQVLRILEKLGWVDHSFGLNLPKIVARRTGHWWWALEYQT